jgi:hypothetical protein
MLREAIEGWALVQVIEAYLNVMAINLWFPYLWRLLKMSRRLLSGKGWKISGKQD